MYHKEEIGNPVNLYARSCARNFESYYYKINRILEAKEYIYQALIQGGSVRKPNEMVEILFTQPYATVRHFTEKNIYSENTARRYLNTLVKMGILDKKQVNGHHYYQNIDLYNILAE